MNKRMDDGANPKEWVNADILIVGVSRTGKTPLSIYLGQRGYKVANLPLVLRDGALMVPTQINEIDSKRVFGLLIAPGTSRGFPKSGGTLFADCPPVLLTQVTVPTDPFLSFVSDVLHVIRKNRLSNLGVGKQFAYDGAKSYAASRQVTEELSLAKALYAENSDWQVLDVTHKGVEETAARIMKLMYRNEKQNEDARIHR
jgi:regulator of PEP synthase PpsR (kinase-PPPase family)|tara:strand:+ start:3688 stop:4287 length:600 start_codon:yes stop_codon:yes gene_type:complete